MNFLVLNEKPFNKISINTVNRKRTRKGPYKHLTLEEYKQDYYLRNLDKYTNRNQKQTAENQLLRYENKASEQELISNIEKMSSAIIINNLHIFLNEKK
jgi:hypothetical protein